MEQPNLSSFRGALCACRDISKAREARSDSAIPTETGQTYLKALSGIQLFRLCIIVVSGEFIGICDRGTKASPAEYSRYLAKVWAEFGTFFHGRNHGDYLTVEIYQPERTLGWTFLPAVPE